MPAIPELHPTSGLYPPCQNCGSGGYPADFMAENFTGQQQPYCIDCLVLACATLGRPDLAASIANQRNEVNAARQDPKSMSFRGSAPSPLLRPPPRRFRP